jgi:hypothetical protein
MYLMGITPSDIALAINEAPAIMQEPRREHWKGVNQILAYLAKTIYRKSTTGNCVPLQRWPSVMGQQRHRAMALSTTDAEFYATSKGARESIWFKSLILELLIDVGQVLIPCDSKCAVSLIHDGRTSSKNKTLQYWFLRKIYILFMLMIINLLKNRITPFDQVLIALQFSGT